MFASLLSHKLASLGAVLFIIAVLLLGGVALSWTGPTAAPPGNNVDAPINEGSTDQIKNAAFGANGLVSYGNFNANGSNNYFVFGTVQSPIANSYGFRDNGGVMEYKNSGGNWTSFSGTLGWIVSGNDIYNANSANVGVGMTAPAAKFSVSSASTATLTNLTQAVSSAGILIETTYTANNYTPGIFWRTTNDNATRPKAGIWLQATGSGTNLHFGTSNAYSTGITNSTMRLDPSANLFATSFLYASDKRLKDDIVSLQGGLEKVTALSPVSFTWIKDSGPRAGEGDIGFIAQEVEDIVPEAVVTGQDGYKAIDYPRLMPLLVLAIQEQQAQIDSLKSDIEALKAAQ